MSFESIIPKNLFPAEHLWMLPEGISLVHREPYADDLISCSGLHLYVNADRSKRWSEKLPELKALKYLRLRGRINSKLLSSVAGLVGLERLDIGDLRADTLEPLSNLSKLEYLTLTGMSRVRKLGPLTNLKSLKSLALGFGTQIESLYEFEKNSLTSLRCLMLDGSGETKAARLDSLSPIRKIKNLEYLSLCNIHCADNSLKFLLDMPKIKGIELVFRKRWKSEEIKILQSGGKIKVNIFS